MQAEPPPPAYPGYPTPNTNRLSELTLVSPAPQALFYRSKSRDIALHSYTSEPALFYLALLTSIPSPIKIRLTEGNSKNGNVVGTCEPAEKPGQKPGAWRINVDNMRGEAKGEGQLMTRMERLGGGTYRWVLPCLDPERVLSAAEDVLLWTYTPQDKTERKEGSFANPDWKLQNSATGEVHAVLIERRGTKEIEAVQFRRSFGRDWELAVLLAVGVVAEGERRAKLRRDGGGFTRGFLFQ